MTDADPVADLVAQRLAARTKDEADDLEEALADIAARRPETLTDHLGALAAAGVWWPPAMYCRANDRTRAAIVDAIDAGTVGNLNHALLALAYAGGTVAETAFRRWASQPPPGAGDLHVPTTSYTVEGGWMLAPGSGVRPLCGESAYTLVPDGRAANAAQECPWCDSPLWTPLHVDTVDPRIAAALEHTAWSGRLTLRTCYFCTCYTTVYCVIDADGQARWAPHNRRPAFLGNSAREEPTTTALTVDDQRTSPYGANAWDPGGSTLGGYPDWIQYAAYPACLSCGDTMSYLGLLGGADIADGEGAYYLFVHTPCRIGATVYQQS